MLRALKHLYTEATQTDAISLWIVNIFVSKELFEFNNGPLYIPVNAVCSLCVCVCAQKCFVLSVRLFNEMMLIDGRTRQESGE